LVVIFLTVSADDSATQIDLLEGLNLSTLHGLTFDDVESGSVPKEEMLKDLFNLDDYDYEYDMYGAGSANSLGSDNIKGERRGSTFSNLATSPSIFDMDLLGDEGAADYPTEPSSYEGKDQLVLLEKLTDSFANSEDRRNKNRSGSTMSLSAAFRDDFKSDAILGNGSANSRSNPVAIPNQKARGRQASANVASQRARKPQQHKKVNSTQQPAVYAPNVSKTDGSTHMVDGEQKKSTEGNKIGAYSPNSRNKLVLEFLAKRQHRSWKKKVKYGVRKKFADSRLRVKGRFVKKEDEAMLRLYLLMCF